MHFAGSGSKENEDDTRGVQSSKWFIRGNRIPLDLSLNEVPVAANNPSMSSVEPEAASMNDDQGPKYERSYEEWVRMLPFGYCV